MPMDRMGFVPGSVGDMIIESQRQLRPRGGMRPMQVRQKQSCISQEHPCRGTLR